MTGGLAASRDSRPEWRATSIGEERFSVRRARGVPHVSPTGTAAERNDYPPPIGGGRHKPLPFLSAGGFIYRFLVREVRASVLTKFDRGVTTTLRIHFVLRGRSFQQPFR
jgi:hypothetical protein